EDGIRDGHVTGVQTCALPIYLEVIKCADWIIDLGPEGGEEGGQVVAIGTPEKVAEAEQSHTGRFLRGVLHRAVIPSAVEGPPNEIGRASCREGVWVSRGSEEW